MRQIQTWIMGIVKIKTKSTSVNGYKITLTSQSASPEVIKECQGLRYRVFHDHLGMKTPDMDHQRELDIQEKEIHLQEYAR